MNEKRQILTAAQVRALLPVLAVLLLLLAAGLAPLDAGSAGAYLHGLSGRFAADGAPVGAHDVAEGIPEAWRDVVG